MEENKKFKLVSSKKTRYLLPNILTLAGVCLGISSIKFSIDGNFFEHIYEDDRFHFTEFDYMTGPQFTSARLPNQLIFARGPKNHQLFI